MMNLGKKQDLDALLDGLKGWPALDRSGAPVDDRREQGDGRDEAAWEARAQATLKKVELESRAGDHSDSDVLLEAPALSPEPGESGAVLRSGERKMPDERDEKTDDQPSSMPSTSEAMSEAPPSTQAPPSRVGPGGPKRTSLKEMAARASQSGQSGLSSQRPSQRPSQPGTPLPSAATPLPSSRPSPSLPGSRPSATPLPRPVEAGKDDSGVIDLNVVRASVTAQQAAAAEKAKPAQQGLFEDDPTVESAQSPGESPVVGLRPPKVPQVAVVAARRSNAGPMAGAVIAVLGIAAAFAIVLKKAPQHDQVATLSTRPVATMVAEAPSSPPTAVTAPSPGAATPEATAAPSAMASSDATGATPTAPPAGAGAGASPGRLAQGAPLGGAAVKEAPSAAPDPKLAAAGTAKPGDKPGDLASEMARAVGPIKPGDPSAQQTPEPAAGGAHNQNIPEQPSQGSVQAAVGAVMSGAKACVAGADDVSRAVVTFSSAGTVSSVSVSGWAGSNGKSGCIQGALKGAKVGPFSKPSFTFPVTIRP